MAAETFTTLSGALNRIFEGDLASQINRSVVAAGLIPKKSLSSFQVAWDARVGTTAATAESDGASISTYNSDTKVPATLPVATYQDAFKINGRLSAAVQAAGTEAIRDLYAEHVMESLERVASKINADIHSGTGSTSEPITIAGLNQVALLADTGTYANVSRNTYAQWKSNVLSNSGTPRALTVQLMRDMMRTIYVASGGRPNLITCDPVTYEYYGLTFGPYRQWVDEVNVGGETVKLDAGFKALSFDGIPVVQDRDCVAGTMNFLDTNNNVMMRTLAPTPMQMGAASGQAEAQGSPSFDASGGTGIRARIQQLSNDGDFAVFQVLTYLQLQVRSPSKCGVIKDLLTS
jgi:hypothetical protein